MDAGTITTNVEVTDLAGNRATNSDTADYVINSKPTTSDDLISTNEDTAITLSINDFGDYSDIENDSMSDIKIESLPTNGILLLNGVAISAGTEISVADINSGNLVFNPTSNSDANSSFDFKVSDGSDWSETSTTTINIEAVADAPINLSLDVSRDNSNIVIDGETNTIVNGDNSNVTTIEGVDYSLSFNYSGDEIVNVYLGDTLVGILDASTTSDVTHSFELSGLDGTQALTFKDNNGNTISGISDEYMSPLESMIEYNVDLSAQLTDIDGSETLSIELSGLPTGATLSLGEAGDNGTWIFNTNDTSLNLSDIKMYIPESADTFTLSAKAISTDSNGDTASVSTSDSVVDVLLNSAATSTDDSVTATEDSTLVLNRHDFGTFNDNDGDSFISIKLSSLPENGTLKLLGQDNPNTIDGSVILEAGDIVNVSDMDLGNLVFVPNSNSDEAGSFEFRVGDGYSFSNNSYTTTVNIEAVSDAPIITMAIGTVSHAEGIYDYPIDIETSLTDIDGSESLGNVTLKGIPSEATILANSVEITAVNGEISLTQEQINAGNITMKLPDTASQNFELLASVTSTEDSNDSNKSSSTKVEYTEINSTPIAIDETETIQVEQIASVSQNTNIVMVLDLSGSMNWDGDNSQAGTQSRLSIAKDAIEEMINAYDNLGDVNIKLTTFSSSGATSAWMSASAAIDTINNLSASGWTNYEDAIYKTYTNFTQPDADKTVGFFISDGTPTKENTEGRDVRGNVGQDAESGWLDSTYLDDWNSFVNTNLDELNVIGIGTGISNTKYLEDLATGADSSVKVNTMVVKDVTELGKTITPVVNTIEGTIADNIDYGSDGEGEIVSILVDGVSYTKNSFPSDGITTNVGGKLTFDFDSGNYTYNTVSSISQDYVDRFEVTVADSDGDTTTMNLIMNVNLSETTTSNVDITIGDEVVSGTSSTAWSGVGDISNASNSYNGSVNSDIKLTQNDDELYVNGDTNKEVKTYNGDDTIHITGNTNKLVNTGEGDDSLQIDKSANKEVYLEGGDDKLIIGKNANKIIDAGSGDDEIIIGGDANKDINLGDGDDKLTIGNNSNDEIDAGDGNDEISIGNDSNKAIYTGSGDDRLEIGGNTNKSIDTGFDNDIVIIGGNVCKTIELGNGDDIIQVDGKVWDKIYGGNGTDSIILNNYTKAQYDSDSSLQNRIIGFENIKFKDGSFIGDSNAFDIGSSSTSTNTTYSYEIGFNSTLPENEDITISNIPSGASLKDSLGNELTANSDGTYTVQTDVSGDATLTLESDTQIDSSALESISALNTSVDGVRTYGSSDDEITFDIDIEVDGGEGSDTLVVQEESILDFDSLIAQNIEKVNIENNNQIDSSTLDVEDVIRITDDDNILEIIGDSGDEIGLTNESGDTAWEKSDEKVTTDDGDTFDVWTNDNVTVYIDEDITVTDF